tara:strand:- start:376 stop:552 length:177 start_codon:yes stop_codon:yes gene_type:complete
MSRDLDLLMKKELDSLTTSKDYSSDLLDIKENLIYVYKNINKLRIEIAEIKGLIQGKL